MFPYITLFGKISIPLYGSLFTIGFFAALFAARRMASVFGLTKEDVTYGTMYGVIGMLIGSKLLYLCTKVPGLVIKFDSVLESLGKAPWHTIMYVSGYLLGGFVFYGGLIGTVFGVYRYCKRYRVPFVPFLDIYAPLIPFVHGVGRVGCFFAGCCYGREYHGFGSVQFPYNELVPELSAVPRVPVQLIEAVMNFIVCAVLLAVMKKKKVCPGRLMGVYLIYYTVARFFLEILRGDVARGSIGFISTSQLISILILPVAIILVRGKRVERLNASEVG